LGIHLVGAGCFGNQVLVTERIDHSTGTQLNRVGGVRQIVGWREISGPNDIVNSPQVAQHTGGHHKVRQIQAFDSLTESDGQFGAVTLMQNLVCQHQRGIWPRRVNFESGGILEQIGIACQIGHSTCSQCDHTRKIRHIVIGPQNSGPSHAVNLDQVRQAPIFHGEIGKLQTSDRLTELDADRATVAQLQCRVIDLESDQWRLGVHLVIIRSSCFIGLVACSHNTSFQQAHHIRSVLNIAGWRKDCSPVDPPIRRRKAAEFATLNNEIRNCELLHSRCKADCNR
jgi:hypothetical protein